MILHIEDSMSVADVQDKFSRCFPALKIEFYKKPHHFGKQTQEECIQPEVNLGSIRKNHNPGELLIQSNNTVNDIETAFRKSFGLNVQIFRKEDGFWIQTSYTDRYTLKEQSEMSSYASFWMDLKQKRTS